MVGELARYLARNGWDVTVCAGLPHHPYGRLFDGWHWRPWQRTWEENVEVIRTGHFVHPSRAIPIRGAVYATQALCAAAAALMSRKADIVLVYGPPLVGPNLGAVVAARHGAKHACVVYDIYPDIAVETGRISNPAVIAFSRALETLQHRASDLIIVLAKGLKKTMIEKGVSPEKIAVVPVWLDPDEIKPLPRDNAWRQEQGIDPETFVVLYAGTIGIISGARMVAEAAHLLSDHQEILFLFVGDGDEKIHVKRRSQALGLKNMRFLPFQPRERLSETLATADVGLVTLSPGRGRTSVPSKVLGYMAAGRPVIASVDPDSDTADEIRACNNGIAVPPADGDALAAAVLKTASNRGLLEQYGTASRARFEAQYDKKLVLDSYTERLLGLLDP